MRIVRAADDRDPPVAIHDDAISDVLVAEVEQPHPVAATEAAVGVAERLQLRDREVLVHRAHRDHLRSVPGALEELL